MRQHYSWFTSKTVSEECISGINSLSPSTETINRNLHSVESITDIANIPKQFYCKKYFTPNLNHYRGGGRAIYNLTERIRQAKEKFYYSGGLQTMNHYALQKQNFTDIGDITNPFSMNYYEKNPSGASRSGPYRTESLADMKAIPDPFSPKGLSYLQKSHFRLLFTLRERISLLYIHLIRSRKASKFNQISCLLLYLFWL
ncbi:unnamed protein product [Brugia timori]|uniref:Uncharacterized protein n=1 Tax=Brugia timori TaxID=42155 RepID=A0A0R3QBL3_9BILA|nr:unnamed protein product [Brugia timori]